MLDTEVNAAILIADICGSTSLYEQEGNAAARQLIEETFGLMLGELPAHEGSLINSTGDEIICTFPTPELALNGACAMQNAVGSRNFEHKKSLLIRIGVHYGKVTIEGAKIFGDAVNVTARVAAIARANQIMTTEVVFQQLPDYLKENTLQFINTSIKGKSDAYNIYLVNWEEDNKTYFKTLFSKRIPKFSDQLTIFYKDQLIRVNKEKIVINIGRSEDCDVIVDSPYASRFHANCEWRLGKFIYTDNSTNGSYIRFNDGKAISLLREQAILYDRGGISLGQDDFEVQSNILHFQITPSA